MRTSATTRIEVVPIKRRASATFHTLHKQCCSGRARSPDHDRLLSPGIGRTTHLQVNIIVCPKPRGIVPRSSLSRRPALFLTPGACEQIIQMNSRRSLGPVPFVMWVHAEPLAITHKDCKCGVHVAAAQQAANFVIPEGCSSEGYRERSRMPQLPGSGTPFHASAASARDTGHRSCRGPD
jgi:hypothetical protein